VSACWIAVLATKVAASDEAAMGVAAAGTLD
jgi:hypothetical protein